MAGTNLALVLFRILLCQSVRVISTRYLERNMPNFSKIFESIQSSEHWVNGQYFPLSKEFHDKYCRHCARNKKPGIEDKVILRMKSVFYPCKSMCEIPELRESIKSRPLGKNHIYPEDVVTILDKIIFPNVIATKRESGCKFFVKK